MVFQLLFLRVLDDSIHKNTSFMDTIKIKKRFFVNYF